MSIQSVGLPAALETGWAQLPGALAAGSSSYVTLQTGASNPALPTVPDQRWQIEADGAAESDTRNCLILRGQAAGPSPAVNALTVMPDGNIKAGAGVIAASALYDSAAGAQTSWSTRAAARCT
jgi:hypothetical protein